MSATEPDPEFEALLEYLKRTRGFDFTAYKRSTLERRIRKRMGVVGSDSFPEYTDYLEVHPDEFPELFNTILINMTGFFRDKPAWDYLEAEIIPRIIASKQTDQTIRVWSAGCASGQEAYSVAMLLARALDDDGFRHRVKIYATDVDDDALNQARQGSYATKEVDGIPPDLLETYFERVNDRYVFRKDLRRSIIFGRNDLIDDAPISRIDLLVCRNTLMYFNAEAQARILSHFHFALAPSGFLFLGRGEMLLTHGDLFTPVDLRRRIFEKVPKVGYRDSLVTGGVLAADPLARNPSTRLRLQDEAFDTAPVAQIVVDGSGILTLANAQARALFQLQPRDLGRRTQELDLSYRPTELSMQIDRAYLEHRPIPIKGAVWHKGNETRHFDVHVVPLFDAHGLPLGASVTFTDVTRARRIEDELQRSKQDLETAYEELQSTIEELETTNEELQSTNEELETTNEELQSMNEELETMNEELQSTNEELETTNEELRQRSEELNRTNAYLQSILTSLRVGVVVLDGEYRVRIWNSKATDLWGLREDEVQGEHFLSLDMGLPVDQLRRPIRSILTGETDSLEVQTDATNRRGRSIHCRVTVMPLADSSNPNEAIHGVILLMDDQVHESGSRSTAGQPEPRRS